MMKALTHNIQQEREDQRDRSAQLFMWCIGTRHRSRQGR